METRGSAAIRGEEAQQQLQGALIGTLATDEPPDVDVDELEDADVFVEIKTVRFIQAIGLPIPDGLASVDR